MRKDWKKVKVADLGNVITGNTPPRKNPELYGTHTIFIKPTDIQEETRYTRNPEECYSELGYKKYIKSLIPKGSTCVVTIGSIGKKMTQAHCDCFINQAVNAVVPNEKYDKDFVFYLMKYNLNQVKGLDSGTASGRENVSKSSFSNIEVLVPESLATQQKIASILSAYDDLIENNLRRIKLLEEMAAITYKEWFVNFTIDGQKLEINAETGLPFGWERKKIGELVEVGRGSSPRPISDQRYFEKGSIPWLKIADATASNIFIHKTKEYVNELGASFSRKLKKGSLIVAASGTLGFPMFLGVEACIHDGWIYFQGINDELQEYFYYSFLGLRKHFESISYGAAIQNINTSIVKSAPFILPSKDILIEFKKIVSPIFLNIQNLQNQNRLLKEARDILLSRLMSGEIELT